MTLRKAAFFDRDGVMNDLVERGPDFRLGNGKPCSHTAPFTRKELRLKLGVRHALELAGEKGYVRIMVTNQPDMATGNMRRGDFEEIMDVFRALPLDHLYACVHHPRDACACRKPKPGMLFEAAQKHGIDLAASYMIGDLDTDMQAGRAAGTGTILVNPDPAYKAEADHRVRYVVDAANLLP